MRLEAVKGRAECLALAQDGDPRQARLETVENEFFKQLKVGADTNLPQDFIKAVKRDAEHAITNHIQSIQLWRSIAVKFSLKKKEQKMLYYRVKIQEGTSIKTVYLNHREATFALKFEPWILDTANSLSQVHGYRKITFGDGATLKTENTL
jgi:hypothetical protein